MHSQFLTYHMILGDNFEIPVLTAPPFLSKPQWMEPFKPAFIDKQNQENESAWFHWCTGHQVLSVYWEVMGFAYEKTLKAFQSNQDQLGCSWLIRLATLIHGEAAVMINTGAFEGQIYEHFLRPTMMSIRDDFSALSSPDFLAMQSRKQKLLNFIDDSALQFSPQISDALQFYRDAERFWQNQHRLIAERLHPGDSLLQEKIKTLVKQGDQISMKDYVKNFVESTTAQQQNDAYFGITRIKDLSLEDYWKQAVSKIDLNQMHNELSPEFHKMMVAGNAELLTIIATGLTAITSVATR